MNREEILQRSRNENRGRDELERDTMAKAGQKAAAAGGMICAVIIILEALFSREVSCGTWAVYLSMTGTMLLYKYTRLKRKHELIFAGLQIALAAAFLVMHIVKLAG